MKILSSFRWPLDHKSIYNTSLPISQCLCETLNMLSEDLGHALLAFFANFFRQHMTNRVINSNMNQYIYIALAF